MKKEKQLREAALNLNQFLRKKAEEVNLLQLRLRLIRKNAKPVGKAEETKPAVLQKVIKPKVRNRRATTEDAVSEITTLSL